jgi:putative transposase
LSKPAIEAPKKSGRRSHARRLSEAERQELLELLQSDRFIHKAPAAIFAALLDENRYICSVSTMYRELRKAQEVRERRTANRRINYEKPELRAVAPNQVWTWDITKCAGPQKWTYFYFYAVIDVFSRMITAWTVSTRETAREAEEMITVACWEQAIDPDQLTIHSDRGGPMKSKLVSQLLVDLGVAKSFGRPHVSNDNPYSESYFKTLKSRPEFPPSFASVDEASSFLQGFVDWYNHEHYHGSIAYLTPATVHSGQAHVRIAARQNVLNNAFKVHPERFVRGAPQAWQLPTYAGINLPESDGIEWVVCATTTDGAVIPGATANSLCLQS